MRGGASEPSDKNWKSGHRKKLKFTYQEQKDYETIEGEIAALEDKIAQLEKEKTEALLEEKMDRWMYLEDLAARIEKGELVEN